MVSCPYNPYIRNDMCKKCTTHCGFRSEEIKRRKRKIDKGNGLSVNAKGLRYLKIERREQPSVNAN